MSFRKTVGWSSLIIAVLTLASRLVGLLRVRIFASHFGAGEVLDTYYAAFRIPDFIMGVLIVGTLSIAALPIITQYALKGQGEVRRLVANLLNMTFVSMAAICGLAMLLAPWLVRLVAPGFSDAARVEVIELTRIILLAQVVLAVSNLLTTTLNAVKRFFWAGLAPIMYNVGLICGVIWLYPLFGLSGLAYGVLLGSVLHILAQLPEWYSAGFRFGSILRVDDGMRAVLRLYIPRLFTLDLSQISLLLASIFGSYLAAGSIAVYVLGFDIQAMPVGVFAFAVATASFPHLAEYFAKKNEAQFLELFRISTIRILFYMLPIAISIFLLRAHIVRILYGTGNFNWDDTRATFMVLGVLAFSLIGQSLVPLFSRALLARHNTWAPVVANILSILVTIGVAFGFVPKWGIEGVAAAYAVGVSCNAILLYIWLRNMLAQDSVDEELVVRHGQLLRAEAWKVVHASFWFGLITYGMLHSVANHVNTHTWVGLLVQAALSTGIAGVVYLFLTHMFKLADAKGIIKLIPFTRFYTKDW